MIVHTVSHDFTTGHCVNINTIIYHLCLNKIKLLFQVTNNLSKSREMLI